MARSQTERSAATQLALRRAARHLWGTRGFVDVGTPEIAEIAGVSRGALYHHYRDKTALFVAVLEELEEEIIERLGVAVRTAAPRTPADALRAAADAWLEIAGEPEVRQLVLLDAPTVLGWPGFREISQRYGLGVTEHLLTDAIIEGQLTAQPTRPLATVLLGALDEAALTIANAADPEQERQVVGAVVHDLIDGILAGKPRAETPRTR